MAKIKSTTNFLKTQLQIYKYIGQGVTNSLINRNDPVEKRRNALKITASNSKQILDQLNVKVKTKGERPGLFDRNYFMVCNHMSYLDILILSSVEPAVFVTSVEMEKTFFLGDMAKLGGSFFVDRINRRKMKAEVKALEGLLKDGFNVFIFPEGTSTDGSKVLPFKKSLFRVPFQTGFPILPICLKYKQINGEPFSPKNCDTVCWHGDMTFTPHFLGLMGIKDLETEIQYLNPLDPKDFADHGAITVAAQEQIRAAYNSN